MIDTCWDGAVTTPSFDPQAFAHPKDRERLSGVALKAFCALADRWQLSSAQAATLLGVSRSTWDRIKLGPWAARPLSQDQLTRISAVVGVFKGLHLLFGDDMADRWPNLPNKGSMFQGRTPVEAMIEGGIVTMIETRLHVDGLRNGY